MDATPLIMVIGLLISVLLIFICILIPMVYLKLTDSHDRGRIADDLHKRIYPSLKSKDKRRK